jgi:hypothetical protein
MKHLDRESLYAKNWPSGDPTTSSTLLARLEDALLKSHKFKLVYSNPDVQIKPRQRILYSGVQELLQ